MKRFFFIALAVFFCFAHIAHAQIPTATLVQIVRAEDERRWDAVLEKLMQHPDAQVRTRAALAAGRIGDENAIPALTNLLKDSSVATQTMAMFALGETESPKSANAVLDVLKAQGNADSLRGRALEAAGKIAAANAKDASAPELGKAIVATLNTELGKSTPPSSEVILPGITAVLRARPAGGESVMLKLLSQPNARLRADALNTLARLRSKNANDPARELLAKDADPVIRANAARMLGVGEDKSAIQLLLDAATKDADLRVRVSAIRALGSLKDASVAEKLIPSPGFCQGAGKTASGVSSCSNFKNEYLEIATTLGRLLPNTNNQKAVEFLNKFNEYDKYQSLEIEIALARIAPARYSEFQRNKKESLRSNWKAVSAMMLGIGELASAPDTPEMKPVKEFAKAQAGAYVRSQLLANQREDKALSDALTACANFKPDDLSETLRDALQHPDPIVRAAAAGLLAEQPVNQENVAALKTAFTKALLADKHENDAQLAIMDALFKLDKNQASGNLLIALSAPDYLVRKKAFTLLADKELQKASPGLPTMLESARDRKAEQVLPYAEYTGTRLGQILNTPAEYTRAVSRKNGSVKAILTTSKGNFTIDFYPEDAPLTVDNFIKLARAGYFNGVEVHRVVPNFVMQDGDPRGDGNGGPGWEIRCEINMLPFDRGAVGMALSGKDTGGSQWFVTHSPQPHLDGGYTVFGKVAEADMKVVDNIVRGDKILKVQIVESGMRQPARPARRRTN